MPKRLLQLFFVGFFTLVMLGADDASTRAEKIGHNLVCQCGCGQILMECNHVGCPVSPGMIAELRTAVAGGASNAAIQKTFIAKYGPIVLAAPMRGGFDNVAWIVPIAALLACLVGILALMRVWQRRHRALPQPATLPVIPGSSLHDRIRSETDFDYQPDHRKERL